MFCLGRSRAVMLNRFDFILVAMKKLSVEITDEKSIRKMQRLVLILERLSGAIEEYGDVEIILKVGRKRKFWDILKSKK